MVLEIEGGGLIKEKSSTNDFFRFVHARGIRPQAYSVRDARSTIEQHQLQGWKLSSIAGTTPTGLTDQQYRDPAFQPLYHDMTWFVVLHKRGGRVLKHVIFA